MHSSSLEASIHYTSVGLQIVHALYDHGFISHYYRLPNGSQYKRSKVRVYFRYPAMHRTCDIVAVSRPGHRRYVTLQQLHSLIIRTRANENFFLSTRLGIISAGTAVTYNTGGELLFRMRT